MQNDAILTVDQIKQVEGLADLPDDKVQAIVTLANNAGKQAIDTYAGVSKTRWEKDVEELTGLQKPEGGMKAHEFLKWAYQEKMKDLEELKKTASGTREKELTGQIEEMKKKLENTNSVWKQEAEDAKSLADQLKKKLAETENTYKEQLTAKERENLLTSVRYDLANVESGKEFDPTIPDEVRTAFLNDKREKILQNYTPERVEENGRVVVRWRDKNGNLVRIAEKGMEPATTADLYEKELAPILKKSKQQPGAGSKPGAGSGGTLDLGGAKTQVEATRAIESQLLQEGLARGTQEFTDAKSKIWKENEVSKLPLR